MTSGRSTQAGSPPAPRATFSPAQSGAPAPGGAAGPVKQAPRNVFQPAAPEDPDKTVKRAVPGEWGRTLPLGEALKQGQIVVEPTAQAQGEEATVQVARSAFIKTLLGNEGQPEDSPASQRPPSDAAAAKPGSRPAHGRPGGSFPAPEAGTSQQPEPLREPSSRPAPTPYQQARTVAAQNQSRTILMPGTPGAASQPAPLAASERAAAPAPAHGMAKKTLPLGAAAITVDQLGSGRPSAPGARPAPTPAAATKPLSGSAPRPVASTPAPTPVAPAASAEQRYTGAEPVVLENQSVSQPLQLQLDARDERPDARLSEDPRIPRSRGPLIAGLVVAIAAVAGAAAWFTLRGDEPQPIPEPTRNDAVKATEAVTPQPPPAVPGAAVPVAPVPATAQPTTPATAPTGVAPTPAATPQAAAPTPQAKPAATPKPTPKTAAKRKAEARATKKARAAKRPAADLPEGVQEARDALRSLESGPVMKIEPAEEAESDGPAAPEPPALPEPPEPPADGE